MSPQHLQVKLTLNDSDLPAHAKKGHQLEETKQV